MGIVFNKDAPRSGALPANNLISYIVSLFAGVGLWTAIGVTLVAGLMRGFAGFGSAMLMAPIFAILFGSADMVVTAVSAVIVGFVVLMWSGWKYTGRRSTAATIAVGAVSGAMMATTSVGGPPVLLYLLSGNDPPQVNRANIVTYYFLTQFLLIVIVLATGVAGLEALARAVVLFPVMVLGAWACGRAFHGLASERLYRNVALVILFVTGLFGLLRNWLFGWM